MKNILGRTATLLCIGVLLSHPVLCSAEESKPASSVQSGTSQDAAGKKEEGKPAGSEDAKKKGASDDEPGCNN